MVRWVQLGDGEAHVRCHEYPVADRQVLEIGVDHQVGARLTVVVDPVEATSRSAQPIWTNHVATGSGGRRSRGGGRRPARTRSSGRVRTRRVPALVVPATRSAGRGRGHPLRSRDETIEPEHEHQDGDRATTARTRSPTRRMLRAVVKVVLRFLFLATDATANSARPGPVIATLIEFDQDDGDGGDHRGDDYTGGGGRGPRRSGRSRAGANDAHEGADHRQGSAPWGGVERAAERDQHPHGHRGRARERRGRSSTMSEPTISAAAEHAARLRRGHHPRRHREAGDPPHEPRAVPLRGGRGPGRRRGADRQAGDDRLVPG